MRDFTIAIASFLVLIALGSGARSQEQSHLRPQDVTFRSDGDLIHAILFRGAGEGGHPTVIILHGFPGGEGDLFGIGAAISADGWNALVMNYRGMFRNEGTNTPLHTLADVVAALDYLDNAGLDFVAKDRFVAIGYSYGGWVALMTGACDSRVSCVAGIGAGNLGALAEDISSDPKTRVYWEDAFEKLMRGNPARGVGGEKTVEEILANSFEFDIRNHGEVLSRKPVLLVGGWRDDTAPLEKIMIPIARAIEAVDGSRLTPIVVDDDHAFRYTREAVLVAVRSWLREKCRPMLQP
ncbi:alpha/beta fold hydrolase [bacterium]|nr:alpha/beta fold hydrolase [bacterium]